MVTSILFIEPPKDYWFLMGEYLPPPMGLLTLAAFVEKKLPEVEVDVLDCQAEYKGWNAVERYIQSTNPSVVAVSSVATCNTYIVARTVQIAKNVNEKIVTIVGGQHFSFTAEESLTKYPEIDYIVRGEGEQTIVELIKALKNKKYIYDIKGISFRYKGRIIHTEPRPLIENLDELPFPAYHLVEKNMGKYNFSMMAGNARYMIIESSRGCEHNCAFCTQWVHWGKTWRTKSPKRIVDEIEYFNQNFGGTFFWFTDDNFKIRVYGKEIYEEMKRRRIGKDVMWFVQTRADEIVKNRDVVPRLRDVGNYWMLVGIEHNSNEILKNLRKNMNISESFEAIRILNKNDIFSQATFIIGSRKETAKSLEKLREFSIALNPGLAIYMVLTPFPGTILHRIARRNKWIEDENYANYDMVHAIMGTETLTRDEVQNELYQCYRDFYGSSARKFSGIFSRNPLKRRVYRHFALRSVLRKLKEV